jgi:hypothetical protein
MTHTPGPWAVEWSEEEGNDGVTVESPDGPVAFRVLEVDARLIAAAPDLLAALMRMRDEFNSYADCPSKCDAVRMAFQAIEKAGGE